MDSRIDERTKASETSPGFSGEKIRKCSIINHGINKWFSLAKHPQAAAHHQQNSRQYYEDAATAAAHPWAVGALGSKIFPPAA
jgi:hypothetical protein